MKIRWLLTIAFAACLCAQEILTNDTILRLVKAGLGEDVIVGMVNQQTGRYLLSADAIIALKTGGVSDKVISAMIVRNGVTSMPALNTATGNPAVPQPAPPPISTQPTHPNDGITRVYISDSQSWEMRGGWAAGGNRAGWGGSGYEAGGARPQTAEIIKTFNQRCPEVTITNNVAKADFAVVLDHEGGKGYLRHRNKIAVFNRDGDDIFSDSTRELGSSVKDACKAILARAGVQQSSASVEAPPAVPAANSFGPPPVVPLLFAVPANTPAQIQPVTQPQDTRVVSLAEPQSSAVTPPVPIVAASQPSQPPAQAPAVTIPAPSQPPLPAPQPTKAATLQADAPSHVATPAPAPQPQSDAKPVTDADTKLNLTITSDPAGAAVEINGVAVGATPITVGLTPGTACTITVKKDGFLPWKMNYPTSASGKFSLNANLTKEVFR